MTSLSCRVFSGIARTELGSHALISERGETSTVVPAVYRTLQRHLRLCAGKVGRCAWAFHDRAYIGALTEIVVVTNLKCELREASLQCAATKYALCSVTLVVSRCGFHGLGSIPHSLCVQV